MVGFTLQYELSYTNILAMLDLAHIPFYAAERGEDMPIIVAGGPCVCNGEPLADFFDLMMLGEGEVQLPAVCDTVIQGRKEGLSKQEILRAARRSKAFTFPLCMMFPICRTGGFRAYSPGTVLRQS